MGLQEHQQGQADQPGGRAGREAGGAAAAAVLVVCVVCAGADGARRRVACLLGNGSVHSWLLLRSAGTCCWRAAGAAHAGPPLTRPGHAAATTGPPPPAPTTTPTTPHQVEILNLVSPHPTVAGLKQVYEDRTAGGLDPCPFASLNSSGPPHPSPSPPPTVRPPSPPRPSTSAHSGRAVRGGASCLGASPPPEQPPSPHPLCAPTHTFFSAYCDGAVRGGRAVRAHRQQGHVFRGGCGPPLQTHG